MRIEKISSTVFTPLENGNGVLLNMNTLCYYSLNKTGVAVWRMFEERGSLGLDEVVNAVCQRFDVTDDAALIDMRAFVEHLARFGMVTIN